jgi:hypothetical protein
LIDQNTSPARDDLELSKIRSERFFESGPDLVVALSESEKNLKESTRLDGIEDSCSDSRGVCARYDEPVVDLRACHDRDTGRGNGIN